jgi:hypothetical protein
MPTPPAPWLLRIYSQQTPSPDDPPDADKFYLALGISLVAWGRLEGLFLACLMMVINISEDKRIGEKLPMRLERQAIIWKDAFARIPSLKPHEKDASAFFAEFEELYLFDRNLMIHALWERFLPHLPLAIEVMKIKAVSGASNEIESRRTTISIDELAKFTTKANGLNSALKALGNALSALQGSPPSDAQIL